MDGAPCRSQKPTREFTNSNSFQSTNTIIHAPNENSKKKTTKQTKFGATKRGESTSTQTRKIAREDQKDHRNRVAKNPGRMKLEFVKYLALE
jgi:hypothetical protein